MPWPRTCTRSLAEGAHEIRRCADQRSGMTRLGGSPYSVRSIAGMGPAVHTPAGLLPVILQMAAVM